MPAPELALLSEELFDEVQEEIERRSSVTPERKRRRQTMLPEEKAFLAREASRRSRAKQVKLRKQPKYIISGNLSCGDCGSTVRAIRGGLYGCTNKECGNRNLIRDQIIEQTLEALLAYPLSAVQKDLRRLQSKVKALLLKRGSIEGKLLIKKQQLRNLLSVIARSEAGQETRQFIEELEIACQRLQFRITEIEHELEKFGIREGEEVAEPEKVLGQLYDLAQRCRQFPDDMDVVDRLNDMLRRVVVKNDPGGRLQISVDVEVDFGRLGLF